MKGKRILLCVLSAAVAVSSAGCGKKNTETVKEGDYAGYPHRTFSAGRFLNGYSDHFPTEIFLVREVKTK